MDTCPRTGEKHVPVWLSIELTGNNPTWGNPDNTYVLIHCAECKQYGTLGDTKALEESITWEE